MHDDVFVSDESHVRAHYDSGAELDRLDTPLGIVEFERTREILARHLPDPPALIADIGGGPGRYAIWLARLGYRVVHRDLMPLHVDETRSLALAAGVSIDSAVSDARSLDLPDDAFDAVLLLGPIYHLTRRADRLRALSEARRLGRRGATIHVAAISRWAMRLHGVMVERIDERFPDALTLIEDVERTGTVPPLFEGSFAGFAHRPAQLRAEAGAAGLDVVDLVGVEGIAFALSDLRERLATEEGRSLVIEAARRIERVPELIGLGPHLLLTARIP
jgi:SAM-dependent methyltransferase